MITYRTMKPDDISAGLSLCRTARWNQVARDWEIILQLSPNDCCIAAIDNKVVGTVTTIRYQNSFSWIGMVLVDPAFRGQGIGSQLLKEALKILQNEETIKLDATTAGREVYLKLNFIDEYPLTRMAASAAPATMKESAAESLTTDDFPLLIEFDHEMFGANRQALLKWMFEGAPQYAFKVKVNNKMQGYCLGRNGYNFTHLGPVIAKDLTVAKNLVSAALNNCTGLVILDVLHFDPEWIKWLSSIGFVNQRPFTRMYRGVHITTGASKKQFAILGPEFG